MARVRRGAKPAVERDEVSYSDIFGDLSDEEIGEVEETLETKRAAPEAEINNRPGKQLRLVAESQGVKLTAEELVPRADEKSEEEKVEEVKDPATLFQEIGFAQPLYADFDATKELGIRGDVENLLKNCGLKNFAEKPFPVYPRPAAEFLATVKVFPLLDNPAALKGFGGGFISFTYNGELQSLDFNKINEKFGFEQGLPEAIEVRKQDKDFVWKMLTGEQVYPARAKSTAVRHPAISYAKRVIAKTFHCRHDVNNIYVADMDFLTIAFSKVFDPVEGDALQGDQNGAGLAFMLCKYLEGVRKTTDLTLQKSLRPNKFLCGGIITGMLKAAGVKIDWENEPQKPPEFMNLQYMRTHHIIGGPVKSSLIYYKFTQKNGEDGLIKLPNIDLTSMEKLDNIRFNPKKDHLAGPIIQRSFKTPTTPKEAPKQQQKKSVTNHQSNKTPTAPCICTSDGFREQIRAEITQDLEAKFNDRFHIEMENGLAALKQKFERRLERIEQDLARREKSSEHRPRETPRLEKTPDTRREHRDRDHDRTTPPAPPKPNHQRLPSYRRT